MKYILKKIPLLVWAMLLVGGAFYVVSNGLIPFEGSKGINLLAGLSALVGLLFIAIQLQLQWKNNRIQSEYLNQPNFKFTGYCTKVIEGETPKLCSLPDNNLNQCIDDHWFDMMQIGKLPAKDIKIGLFHAAEETVNILERWQEFEMCYEEDRLEFKLPQFTIPFDHFIPEANNHFHILIRYTSAYSRIKYRRCYELNYSINQDPAQRNHGDWKGRILYLGISLEHLTDSDSISVGLYLKGLFNRLIRWLKFKKSMTLEEWLVEL